MHQIKWKISANKDRADNKIKNKDVEDGNLKIKGNEEIIDLYHE